MARQRLTPEQKVYNKKRVTKYEKMNDRTQHKVAYENVEVCDEWKGKEGRKAFYSWYDSNIYELPNGEFVELDKDLLQLHKLKKVYSPETCVFLPKSVNLCLRDFEDSQGYERVGDRYKVVICTDGKRECYGTYDTPEEAERVYRQVKKDCLKSLAVEYEEYLPPAVYSAMMSV